MPLERMREHVACHILASDVAVHCCGYCGLDCKPVLVPPKIRGRARSLTQLDQAGTESCATRRFKGGNAALYIGDNQKGVKCTNYLARCPECNEVMWKYAKESHYQQMHQLELPSRLVVTMEERKKLCPSLPDQQLAQALKHKQR
jgi:hypothetical protein